MYQVDPASESVDEWGRMRRLGVNGLAVVQSCIISGRPSLVLRGRLVMSSVSAGLTEEAQVGIRRHPPSRREGEGMTPDIRIDAQQVLSTSVVLAK